MSDRMKFGVIKGIGLQDRSLAFSTTKAGAFAEQCTINRLRRTGGDKMKNKLITMLCVFASLLSFSCSSQSFLQKRTDRPIKKSHKKTDTVYLYSVAFNNFNFIWYHKGDYLYGFYVKPHKTKKYEPVEAKNIIMSKESIDKYFDTSLYKDVECFVHMLDGEGIDLYVKGESRMFSSIDTDCLFNTKFEPNSFPYKLQYDFFKLRRSPIGFDFEKMYSE